MTYRYKHRWIAEKMRDALEFSPVIVLSGARQTGKSTLFQNEEPFRGWHYITFDDLDTLSIAEKRPDEILNITKNIVIDEDINSRFAAGLVVYAGKEVKQLSSNIFAVPWDML